MIEQFLHLAFFGSFAWFCVISIALIACFIWSELDEHGGIAFVAVLGYLILNHFFGNVPTKDLFTWWNVAGYLFIGLVYALTRTYFFGKEQQGYKPSSSLFVEKDNSIPYELKENVFRWWFLWPISLIVWLCSDVLGKLWDKIYDLSSSLFLFMYKLGFKSGKKENNVS